MFIVGLTGGLATGKSSVLKIFADHGIPVIDADQIARDVVEPGQAAYHLIRREFGDDIFSPDGQLNRAALGALVFDDPDKRRTLNRITHPCIQRRISYTAIRYLLKGHPFIVVELPLLFETGRMMIFIYKIITVVCEHSQQVERLCLRNEFDPHVARKRIETQMPLEQKVANSHFVVDNSGTLQDTKEQAERVIRVLRSYNYHWVVRLAAIFVVLVIPSVAAYAIYYLWPIGT